MSTGKIVLIIAAVVFALIGALAGGGYLWFQKNSVRLKEEGKAAMREGAHFGSGKPAQACVDEALRRLTSEMGIIDEARNKSFLSACLKVAQLTPEFCAGIPPRSEIVQTATWAVARCGELNRPDQACTRLIGAVQERCVGRNQS